MNNNKYVVVAFPPKKGFWSGLKPRIQMWNDGTDVIYESLIDAKLQQDICNSEIHRTWSYGAYSYISWK